VKQLQELLAEEWNQSGGVGVWEQWELESGGEWGLVSNDPWEPVTGDKWEPLLGDE